MRRYYQVTYRNQPQANSLVPMAFSTLALARLYQDAQHDTVCSKIVQGDDYEGTVEIHDSLPRWI